MKKYKLINRKNKEETICAKVNVDGFDYYVSDDEIKKSMPYIHFGITHNTKEHYSNLCQCHYPTRKLEGREELFVDGMFAKDCKKIICSTNPNIDIPKVIDEVDIAEQILKEDKDYSIEGFSEYQNGRFNGIIEGYNKHKETNPFSEEDMVEFNEWKDNLTPSQKCTLHPPSGSGNSIGVFNLTPKELIKKWEEQKVETIYYE